MAISRRILLVAGASALVLSGCAGRFKTWYNEPLSPSVTKGWHVVDVQVDVPQSLTVSEAKSLEPRADIVWREDPPGDRRAQVATIMENAVRLGSKGLRGPRPVILQLTMTRFHALTFEAETRLSNAGVHNINFVIQVVDASTKEVLVPPIDIDAALPALSGNQMRAARARGETQKSQITYHVAQTIAGWLGTGPDARRSFTRMGI
ncbi:hypothetical protein L0V05_14595 [Tabrizicola sp. J26]|nr:hypothetical protein [Tabrizicola rongguiensis]